MIVFACQKKFRIPATFSLINTYGENKLYHIESEELNDLCDSIFFCRPEMLKLSVDILGLTELIVVYPDGCFRLKAETEPMDAL